MPDFLPYAKPALTKEDIKAASEVLASGKIAMGHKVKEFEEHLCQTCGANYAVAVSSGTAALFMAYQMVFSKVECVITSPNTFTATAQQARHLGLRIRLLDLAPDSYQMNIGEDDILVSKVRYGWVPVAFGGEAPHQIDKLFELHRRGVPIVIDSSHWLGGWAQIEENQLIKAGSCSFAQAEVLSFQATKNITTGEGGAILTKDEALADQLRLLRSHGMANASDPTALANITPGYNFRLTDFQAVLGLCQLKRLRQITSHRRELIQAYERQLQDIPQLRLPHIDEGHACHLFVIRCERRNELAAYLRKAGIGSQIHYFPIHKQQWFVDSLAQKELPNANSYYESALSLPLHSGMTLFDVGRVVNEIKRFFR